MDAEFNVMNIVYFCAVILLFTKLFGLATRKIGLPQVVGMILAGIVIGPAVFAKLGTDFHGIINPNAVEMEVLHSFSQIGVIFILFSSGLETDIMELKKSGLAATMIAIIGVALPVVLGAGGALMFMGGLGEITNHAKLMNALFVGCILAATSVGITVETLRELGRLNTKVGTTILSAAIIDDVFGIIVLSIITGSNNGGNIGITILKAIGFFACAIGVGLILRILFKKIEEWYPHTRRTSIFALSMCFFYAYCAEEFFGLAAITGAFMAGLMLSGLGETSVVDRKIVINGYMLFTPIFFAYIGISADFSNFQVSDLLFVLVFVGLGIIGKIVGCSLVAGAFKYGAKGSFAIGCGMIARGEVALAVYAAGSGLIYMEEGKLAGIDPLVATIFLIIGSSILCPILLKAAFKEHTPIYVETNHSRKTISTEAMENHEEKVK